MRSSRAMFVLAAAAASVLMVGCGSGGETVASPDLGRGNVESGSPGQTTDTGVDGSAVRSGAEANNSSRAGADDATDAGRPTPPTLSAAGASALATSTTVAPATSAPTTKPTNAPGPTASTTPAPASSTSTTPGNGSTSTTVAVAAADLDVGEDRSFALLNELRASLSQPALAADAEMDAFARDWSRQMASSGNFVHSTGPYGENIAFTSDTALTASEAAALFHDLWLDSPGHYGNMTNASYVKSGVGLYLTERGWYATHVFSY